MKNSRQKKRILKGGGLVKIIVRGMVKNFFKLPKVGLIKWNKSDFLERKKRAI